MTFLVTGTSSGIGRAIAVRLAERGHDVVAGVRKIADAPAHPRIRPVELDVTDAAQLAAVAKDIGPLSGLVNNAGVTVSAPVEHIPLDRLRAQFEVNVVGVVAVCQAFLPAVRAGRGRVVMISSSSGRVAIPLLGAYSASKFAVEALSDSLRQELRPWNVPVVVVEPGSFQSRNRASTEAAAAADRVTMGETAERQYGSATDTYLEFSRKVEAGAGAPERVAAVVERALTAKRPRSRYQVGADAHLLLALGRVLPGRAMDVVLAKSLGSPS
ncbi:SDR family NAD(P)-dependent oxidoreductase [Amycolatopsis solani]|uniref:SDR family NAD(P)-dependent oxidoreductase n=1 Tax=Amycolatopsis solani TaxID=3028615 RepID=UPI0025B035C1|nr:SDR family NAD(P)-dependent oxidoreductase [Amycolatopsis sp. MEP2-6]